MRAHIHCASTDCTLCPVACPVKQTSAAGAEAGTAAAAGGDDDDDGDSSGPAHPAAAAAGSEDTAEDQIAELSRACAANFAVQLAQLVKKTRK